MLESTGIPKQETRKGVRAWIWFWYHDITRLALVFGVPALLAALVLAWLGVEGESQKNGVIAAYAVALVWASLDNDYSQLRRIGLDEYRRPLAGVTTPDSSTAQHRQFDA